MKLAAVYVTYRFDAAEARRNLMSYADGVDLLIVHDNSECPATDWASLIGTRTPMVVHAEGCNVGLATAYNRAADEARRAGCTHLMTMDQDSRFVGFGIYRALIEQRVPDHGDELYFPTGQCRPNSFRTLVSAQNSGCVVPLDVMDRIGGYREDFFLSMVDAEFQVRAQEHDYRLVAVESEQIGFIHKVGSGREVGGVIRFRTDDYSPLRHYYDSRNRFLLAHLYPNEYSRRELCRYVRGRLSVMARIWLAESQKWAKSKAIVRGTINGMANRYEPF